MPTLTTSSTIPRRHRARRRRRRTASTLGMVAGLNTACVTSVSNAQPHVAAQGESARPSAISSRTTGAGTCSIRPRSDWLVTRTPSPICARGDQRGRRRASACRSAARRPARSTSKVRRPYDRLCRTWPIVPARQLIAPATPSAHALQQCLKHKARFFIEYSRSIC